MSDERMDPYGEARKFVCKQVGKIPPPAVGALSAYIDARENYENKPDDIDLFNESTLALVELEKFCYKYEAVMVAHTTVDGIFNSTNGLIQD